jgi:hypothetical protein
MSTARRNLDALKSAFSQKASGGGGDQSWKLFYPFWKMPDDSVAVVRFLPDLDEENNLGFLVENLQHELVINGERKKVPCLSMHGEHCPICELSRKYYDEKDEAMGKKYYKKKSYIGQVIVVESPIDHDQNALVKLIEFGPKIFKQIQTAFQSGDLDEAPFELKGGYNFRIRKTKSGQYSDYGTSSFAGKQTDLDDDLIEALTTSLFNLKDYRTKYVDRATLEAMLIADQTGQAFREEDGGDAQEAEAPTVKPEVVEAKPAAVKAETVQTPAAEGTSKSSVLEQLRARAKAAAAAAKSE